MIPHALLVIVITSAVLSLCGVIAWAGERFETLRARRTKQRIRAGLHVGRRNGGFHDGAVQP